MGLMMPVFTGHHIASTTVINIEEPKMSIMLTEDETTTEDIVETNESKLRYDLSDQELDLLARLVTAEARNEPFEGKIAVAEVVFNRIASDEFPNNLTDVIYQKKQFQPTRNGAIETKATETSIEAVEEALNHSNIAHNALYFYNYQTAQSRWLDQFPVITTIGNHTFK